jgi:prepilin-type N-terminal cleavage/methylation domain-containing protein
MQNIKLNRKGRKGFTLVEVALAVAVGLIVIGGAIVGFNAVRENAQNSSARQKVDGAVGIVENLAAANNQIYPASVAGAGAGTGIFSTTWAKQRPDFGANPWGGPTLDTADGVTEVAPGDFGSAAMLATPAAAATVTAPATTGTEGAGNIIYQTATATSQWGTVQDTSDAQFKVVKGYYLTLYGKDGIPMWYVKGGK